MKIAARIARASVVASSVLLVGTYVCYQAGVIQLPFATAGPRRIMAEAESRGLAAPAAAPSSDTASSPAVANGAGASGLAHTEILITRDSRFSYPVLRRDAVMLPGSKMAIVFTPDDFSPPLTAGGHPADEPRVSVFDLPAIKLTASTATTPGFFTESSAVSSTSVLHHSACVITEPSAPVQVTDPESNRHSLKWIANSTFPPPSWFGRMAQQLPSGSSPNAGLVLSPDPVWGTIIVFQWSMSMQSAALSDSIDPIKAIVIDPMPPAVLPSAGAATLVIPEQQQIFMGSSKLGLVMTPQQATTMLRITTNADRNARGATRVISPTPSITTAVP